MNEHEHRLNESLSALMDGEISEMELLRLLKEMESRPELRERWQRYQMVSSVMRREHSPLVVDCSLAIAEAIDREETHKRGLFASVGSAAGRFAVAASVAAVTLLGVQQLQVAGDVNHAAVQVVTASQEAQYSTPALQFPTTFQPVIEARTVSAGGTPRVSQHDVPVVPVVAGQLSSYSEEELRNYLKSLMDQHSSNSALNSNQGMFPYARQSRSGARSE